MQLENLTKKSVNYNGSENGPLAVIIWLSYITISDEVNKVMKDYSFW